jgi:hypothetical protein
MLLPTLLVFADVNFLLEGIVVALLQPAADYPAGALACFVDVCAVPPRRRLLGRHPVVPVVPFCVPLLWVVLLYLTSLMSLLADALPLLVPSLVDAFATECV